MVFLPTLHHYWCQLINHRKLIQTDKTSYWKMSPLCWTCGVVSRMLMLEMYRDAESMFAFSPVTIQQTCRSWQKKTHLNFLFCNRDCDLNQSENISLFWSTCVMFYHWEMQKYETFITFLRGKNNISHYNYFERCYLKCLPAPLYIVLSELEMYQQIDVTVTCCSHPSPYPPSSTSYSLSC